MLMDFSSEFSVCGSVPQTPPFLMRPFAFEPTDPRPTLHAPYTPPVPTYLAEKPLRLPRG